MMADKMSEEHVETIGGVIDEIENLISSLSLPVPNDIHVKSMRKLLPEIKEKLKNVYLLCGGEDLWSD